LAKNKQQVQLQEFSAGLRPNATSRHFANMAKLQIPASAEMTGHGVRGV
jgi:hypothetical protein